MRTMQCFIALEYPRPLTVFDLEVVFQYSVAKVGVVFAVARGKQVSLLTSLTSDGTRYGTKTRARGSGTRFNSVPRHLKGTGFFPLLPLVEMRHIHCP